MKGTEKNYFSSQKYIQTGSTLLAYGLCVTFDHNQTFATADGYTINFPEDLGSLTENLSLVKI